MEQVWTKKVQKEIKEIVFDALKENTQEKFDPFNSLHKKESTIILYNV